MRKLLALFLFLFCTLGYAEENTHPQNQSLFPFTAKEDAARFQALTEEIRCVVCQNQNIADSHAPLAEDLRKKIYVMIQNHQTDSEIKQYLVDRYGEFILFKPAFNTMNALLWLFPLLALLFALFFLLRFFRSHRS